MRVIFHCVDNELYGAYQKNKPFKNYHILFEKCPEPFENYSVGGCIGMQKEGSKQSEKPDFKDDNLTVYDGL